MFICERCGKEHDGTFGSGRFCSRSCANSKKHSEETKRKIQQGVLKHNEANANKKLEKERIKQERKDQRLRESEIYQSAKKYARDTFISSDSVKQVPNFPDYAADIYGNVYKIYNMEKISPFNSCGYYQVCLYDLSHKKYTKGVHQVIAMTFMDEYYDGCSVHHKDSDRHNNCLDNLEVLSQSDHARLHVDPNRLKDYVLTNGPANKGKKMSKEFCEHCRESAIKRAERERAEGIKRGDSSIRHGNQFRNADGTKKEMSKEDYENFCESCRKAALKRAKKKKT